MNKMNILFDQTEAQATFWNGAAEYAQAVFAQIVALLPNYPEVKIYCLYSSKKEFRYKSLAPSKFHNNKQIHYVDYNNRKIKDIINLYKIDLLFVTCAQSFCDLKLGDLKNLGCKVVCVIHDLLDEEMANSKIQLFSLINSPHKLLRFVLGRIHVRLKARSLTSRQKTLKEFIQNNDVHIITVSEYTQYAIMYNYPELKQRITVYSAPHKVINIKGENIDNKELENIINKQEKYFLLLSADRPLKNATRMLNAFQAFIRDHNMNIKIITVGYGKKLFKEHISLPFLSVSDLEQAYKNCYALLYPSLFEGFGYPPIEAMKYGKPILCSNVCSMKEILEKAPIYFSPIYETDMYKAFMKFSKVSYSDLCEKSYKQYKKVTAKQEADLNSLVTRLLVGSFLNREI